jgi:hypothetical protein
MATFNSYEELKAAVEARRAETLTMEVELGSTYSQEYEDAKAELAKAEVMKGITGGGFLGDVVEPLRQRVAELKPDAPSVFVRYKRLALVEFSNLIKKAGMQPMDQYEEVLPKTFVGLYGQDPEAAEEGQTIEPLTTDPSVLSSRSDNGILPGGALHGVVQAFLNWQNSGGDVTIRPTNSGRA